jgi:hypothetical protein
MKKTNTIFFSALFLLVALLAGQHTSNAARPGPNPLGIQSYVGKFVDGTKLEIIYAARTGKLGVVIKSAEGEPISAHLLQGVKDPRGKFDLTEARKYGQADDSPLMSIEISNLSKDTLAVKAKSESRTYSMDAVMQQESFYMVEAALKCDNYCRPSDPNHFNWWLCFWCCATASGPCV